MRTRSGSFLLGLLLLLSACGGNDSDAAASGAAADDTAAVAAAPAAEAASTSQASADTVLTPEDLDRYQRGVGKETELLRDAQQRKAEAKTGSDTLEVLGSVQEWQLRPEAAKAAGVDEGRWQLIQGRVDAVLSKLQMGPAMMAQMNAMDTTSLPPAQRAQVRENMKQAQAAYGDPYAGLAPETAEAFRARADELGRLRTEYMEALAKVSGLTGS
jgi:hypothetical protein